MKCPGATPASFANFSLIAKGNGLVFVSLVAATYTLALGKALIAL